MNLAQQSGQQSLGPSGSKSPKTPNKPKSQKADGDTEGQSSKKGTSKPRQQGPKVRDFLLAFFALDTVPAFEAEMKQDKDTYTKVSYGFGIFEYRFKRQFRQSQIDGWVQKFPGKVEQLNKQTFRGILEKVEEEECVIRTKTEMSYQTYLALCVSSSSLNEELRKHVISQKQEIVDERAGETVDERAEEIVDEAERISKYLAELPNMVIDAEKIIKNVITDYEAKERDKASHRVAAEEIKAKKKIADDVAETEAELKKVLYAESKADVQEKLRDYATLARTAIQQRMAEYETRAKDEIQQRMTEYEAQAKAEIQKRMTEYEAETRKRIEEECDPQSRKRFQVPEKRKQKPTGQQREEFLSGKLDTPKLCFPDGNDEELMAVMKSDSDIEKNC